MNIRKAGLLLSVLLSLLVAQTAVAQAPAAKPANATGMCNDGTYYTGATKQGACRGHQGVKEWYGSPSGTKASEGTASAGTASTAGSAAAAPQSATATTSKSGTTTAPAPGGGADKVWLNTASNVYHCPGTRYYGTTKAGAYMTEAEAKAKGAHPDHGKPCK
jgi:hypothetical protein